MKITKRTARKDLRYPCVHCRELVQGGQDYVVLVIIRERNIWLVVHLDCLAGWLRSLKPKERVYAGRSPTLKLNPEEKAWRKSLIARYSYYRRRRVECVGNGGELPYDDKIEEIYSLLRELGGIPRKW